ncbi:unnamed protein product [Cyprideis torosa]|uniref:Cytochrome c oxidase subunit 1 n=1 Tax=Cyprideis torosa TaxID=163714 RepID=A0A7R8WME1_9CRUS|nr:unnamed protein product [Cyprideis torosa]CAG0898386.1 unnamed protein product [Cyprideis torosa]
MATLHNEHHHEETFLTKYIFSQDHKMIAKQFLLTGVFWSIVGAFLSVIFRLQLGWPEETFPFLETLFGKWAEGAGLSGTFANLLIPYQIGARDMASPFMNMLSYWFFFLAGVVMLSSMFVQTGAASGGWTMYPPLSGMRNTAVNLGSEIGTDLWFLGMALFIVSSLIGGLNYVSTILNMRTKGMTMWRLPLTIWALLFTAIIGILAFPPLLSAALLLEFDRVLDTSFYLSDIIVGGHPEVYIIILPAMGITSEILSVNSRKPVFGYKAMVYALGVIVFLGFLVWAHHMYVTGMNPFVGSIFVLFTLMIAIPSAVKVFNWLTTIWKGNLRLTVGMMFALGFVSLFISGGITGLFLGNSAVDIQLHDTYFVVAHFHVVMGVAAFFAMFAGVYHWFPKMFGRFLNDTLGYIHFYVTIISAYAIFIPMHFMFSLPRRYYTYANFQTFNLFEDANKFMTVFAIISFLAQLIFVVNIVYSAIKGRKMTEDDPNPWKSNTLEWTTPVEHFHGNWPGDIPEVHRWPYDYSTGFGNTDFRPQTEKLEEGEEEH